jgi:hypothetical protein
LSFQSQTTHHKLELLNAEEKYHEAQLSYWTKVQKTPLTDQHEKWLDQYSDLDQQHINKSIVVGQNETPNSNNKPATTF